MPLKRKGTSTATAAAAMVTSGAQNNDETPVAYALSGLSRGASSVLSIFARRSAPSESRFIQPGAKRSQSTFNPDLILLKSPRNRVQLLYPHWGGNRPGRVEGPAPETGPGFFDSSGTCPLRSLSLPHHRSGIAALPACNSFLTSCLPITCTGRLFRGNIAASRAGFAACDRAFSICWGSY